MFLADQGRDAVIIKRIVTGEHFPAIGAPTSVGQVYLGPFYYYFIAPWLALFNFNPAGLAVGVAVFSTVFLAAVYYFMERFFDKRVALIAVFLSAFSYVLVDLSRFSWNPNLLPLFSFLTAAFFLQAIKTRKLMFFFLFGSFLSFSIQLHYLAASLALPILILGIIDLIRERKEFIKNFLKYLLSLAAFILFSSPLIIFDLRHNLLNYGNFVKLLKGGSGIGQGKIASLVQTFTDLNQYLFNVNISNPTALVLFAAVLILFVLYLVKKDYHRYIFIFIFLCLLFVTSLYPGVKHAHYLGMLYPFYIIILSLFMGEIFKYGWLDRALVVFFLSAFFYLNGLKYDFLVKVPNNQIGHAREVADFIYPLIKADKFSFAVQPDGWQEDSYLYFLELKGKVPQDRKLLRVGQEMFVVCGNECDLKKTKSWNISMFGKSKIAGQWEASGVRIYRLVHSK